MNNKENRKLSTILAMDVVGYSSKMADDDEGKLKLLAEKRLIIEKLILKNSWEAGFLIQQAMLL